MTRSRFLPLLNLAGCLAITAIIVVQWVNEHRLQDELAKARDKAVEIQNQYEAEKTHVATLENDVRQLKESVETAAAARKASEDAMAKLVAERDAHLATATTESSAREEQVKAWEKSLAERDAKILELNATLISTRERLDEAITKLKQAGAR